MTITNGATTFPLQFEGMPDQYTLMLDLECSILDVVTFLHGIVTIHNQDNEGADIKFSISSIDRVAAMGTVTRAVVRGERVE